MTSPDRSVVARNVNYLQNIEQHLQSYNWLSTQRYNNSTLTSCSKVALLSFALNVRARYGQDVSKEVAALLERFKVEKDFTLEALGWLLFALKK